MSVNHNNNKSINSIKGPRQHSVGHGSANNISQASSVIALSNFCSVNELEKSMSYIERTAKKLLPILIEVKKRMIPDKKTSTDKKVFNNQDSDDDDIVIDLSKNKGKKIKGSVFDMKNILGYLN
jgi:hypothetical protein